MNLDSAIAFATNIPTDWIIIGSIAIFVAFDSVRSGARRACQFALALPATALLLDSVSGTVVLKDIARQFATPLLEALLFGIIFAITYILVGRMGLSWRGEAGRTIQSALAGVAATAIAVVFWIHTPALDSLWHFGPQIQEIFGQQYLFFWLIGSFAALAFVRS